MELMTYDPFLSIFDRVFDVKMQPKSFVRGNFSTDIKETETSYELIAELPGVVKENISIEVVDNKLIVSVEEKSSTDSRDGKENFIHKERFNRVCSRSWTLSNLINKDSIEAKLENGLLFITLKKIPKEIPKRIDIS